MATIYWGVHGDECVKERRGRLPLMNLQERVLSVLACRHVDDVLIDVAVNHHAGAPVDARFYSVHGGTAPPGAGAKARKVASPSPLNSSMLAARVEGRRERFYGGTARRPPPRPSGTRAMDAARTVLCGGCVDSFASTALGTFLRE